MDPGEWLEKNGVRCERYSAVISREACKVYAARNPEACSGCLGHARMLVARWLMRAALWLERRGS
jgi:hypothetical protein